MIARQDSTANRLKKRSENVLALETHACLLHDTLIKDGFDLPPPGLMTPR
jgi:hypothetical protein